MIHFWFTQSSSSTLAAKKFLVTTEIHARRVQRADRAAIEDLERVGVQWEQPSGPWERVFEVGGAIVGASSSVVARVARPVFAPEPVPEASAIVEPGEDLALLGQGLVVVQGLTLQMQTRIHRLARTLPSHEIGAKWCVLVAAMQHVSGMQAGAILQQIAFGAIFDAPVTIPIVDGYWPTATYEGFAVLVRDNQP